MTASIVVALPCGGHPRRIAEVTHGVATGLEFHALVAAGQEAAVPLPRGDGLHLAPLAGRGEHDEPRQVLILAPQAVDQPRAHRRPAGNRRAGVHEGVGRIVVDGLGLHRADDAEIVGDRADVREQLQISCPLLPNFWKANCGAKQVSLAPWSWAMGWPLVNDSGMGWPWSCGQLGLVVEGFQVRRPAGLVQPDHPLGLGGEVERIHARRGSRHGLPAGPLPACQRFLGVQQRGQGHGAKAGGGLPEKRPTRDLFPSHVHQLAAFQSSAGEPRQSRVIVSCKFSITRATEVHAASSAGAIRLGRLGIADRQQRRAAAWSAWYWFRCCSYNLPQQFGFGRRGRRCNAWRKAKAIRSAVRAAALAHDPRGQHPRRLHVGRIVQQHQGLQRRVRPWPLDRAFLAGRGVEGQQAGMQERPLPEGVQPAAILVLAVIGQPIRRSGKLRKPQ